MGETFDDEPLQPPTLTELDEARASVQQSRRLAVESLMASEYMPDVDLLLDELVNRPAWHRQAACRGVGTAMFFPTRGERIEPATAICGVCTVREECLGAALEHWDTRGVWGGMSERGRKGLRRGAA